MGGTMRLGIQPAILAEGSTAAERYQSENIVERHRHRYEFNNVYRQQFVAHGVRFSGTSPDGELVEIVEIADHPWFVAVQYHPEFKSKPTKSHPLFAGLVGAAIQRHIGRSDRKKEGETAGTHSPKTESERSGC